MRNLTAVGRGDRVRASRCLPVGCVGVSLFLFGALLPATSSALPPARVDSVQVHVVVFDDLDEDGLQQAGESGLPNIRLTNGLDQLITDDAGRRDVWVDRRNYRFVSMTIPAGKWPTGAWYRHCPYGVQPPDTVYFGLRSSPQSAAEEFRWVHVCDTQFLGWNDPWDMAADWDRIDEVRDPPLFAVNIGDIVNVGSDTTQWDAYMAQLEAADLSVLHAVGNHDTLGTETPLALYEHYVGPPYYSFDAGNWHFSVYNSELVGTPEQDVWLENDIAATAPDRHLALLQHRPAGHTLRAKVQHWADLGIRAVFSGHWHCHQFTRIVDVVEDYTLGRMRYGPLDRTPRSFGLVTMSADGDIVYDLRRFRADHRVALIHPRDGSEPSGDRLRILMQAYDTSSLVADVRAMIRDSAERTLAVSMQGAGPSLWCGEIETSSLEPGPCEVQISVTFDDAQTAHRNAEIVVGTETLHLIQCDDDWPMFRRTPDGRGYVSRRLSPPLNLAWFCPTPGMIALSSPVVSDGVVYIGYRAERRVDDSGLLACDAATGAVIWNAPVPGGVALAPAVVENVVLVTAMSGYAIGLDAGTGEELWRNPFLGTVFDMSAPVVVGEHAFMGGEPRTCKLRWADGEIVWESEILGGDWFPYIYAAPAVAADAVHYGFFGLPGGQNGGNTGAYTILDRNSGAVLFQDLHGAYRSPVVGDDVVFVAGAEVSYHQRLTAREGRGSLIWSAHPELGRGTGSPVLGHGIVVVPGFEGTIQAYDAQTSRLRWCHGVGIALYDIVAGSIYLQGATFSTPAIAEDVVYVGSGDGYLYGLDLFTGEELWNWYVGVPVCSSPAISGNALFVGASDGHLYAFVSADDLPTNVPDDPLAGTEFRFLGPRANPGHGACQFAWYQPHSAEVRLQIHDLRGRLIREIETEAVGAGRHRLEWNGRDRHGRPVASGVYLAVLRAGADRAVQKFALVR